MIRREEILADAELSAFFRGRGANPPGCPSPAFFADSGFVRHGTLPSDQATYIQRLTLAYSKATGALR